MIEPGRPDPLGASWDGEGVNFAIYSAPAEAVQLCLFDAAGNESERIDLPSCSDGVWHGYLPGCGPGQGYGYRVRGRYDPAAGLRFNPNKLLVDPYARELRGGFRWSPAVFDHEQGSAARALVMDKRDSAAFVPRAVVQGAPRVNATRSRVHWSDMAIYETNVRGYTMRHPKVPEADRGSFRGLRNGAILDYIKALGVTSVELMPVHAFVDEEFLQARGLRNYWGYNTLAFFAPEPRLLAGGAVDEFRAMVNAIHDRKLEVILDVVYNHTCEGGKLGPSLSFRGIDNATYYRLLPDDPSEYINDTGCGNTFNVDHPQVRKLILDSLAYWSREMGIDGFRFDLASILGRSAAGFTSEHSFFVELRHDSRLRDVKLIAEPWDVGPGGYQLGGFPLEWAEWNDRFRDGARSFWRGDAHAAPEFARRVHGSADLFEHNGRRPQASVNFVTSHDGFTLTDLVSYAERHNEANGEDNRDGHAHNYSTNHGVEGPSKDPAIRKARRLHRLNLLATLIFSQGTPMLLAGDEFGNSQSGNNNAYAQDNEIGWLDWSGLDADPDFTHQVRAMLALRREAPMLRQSVYRHGRHTPAHDRLDIEWFGPAGVELGDADWQAARAVGVLLPNLELDRRRRNRGLAAALLFNAAGEPQVFELPAMAAAGRWHCRYATDTAVLDEGKGSATLKLGAWSMACLVYGQSGPTRLRKRLAGAIKGLRS